VTYRCPNHAARKPVEGRVRIGTRYYCDACAAHLSRDDAAKFQSWVAGNRERARQLIAAVRFDDRSPEGARDA